MTYIARINIGSPVGQESLQAVPDMVLQVEDIRSLSDESWKFIYWASGDDFETYEDALADDPTIDSYKCLTELPERRLYRITLSDEGQRQTLQPVAVEEDIVGRSLTKTAERVEFLGRFPSRDALYTLRDACREQDRKFELLSLYEEKPTEYDGGQSSRYGVTDTQRDALLAALKQGYFNVPRQTTMENIADSLDISVSALSSRLRRGQQTLLRNTLVQESSDETRE
ncbi:helix-turn-helix domain-containing protein [Natrialbaceae archaeon A-gly3]